MFQEKETSSDEAVIVNNGDNLYETQNVDDDDEVDVEATVVEEPTTGHV